MGEASRVPRRRRLRFSLRTLLILATVVGTVLGVVKWSLRKPPPVYRELPQLLQSFREWEVLEGPDRLGPYQLIGIIVSPSLGSSVSGAFDGRPVSHPGAPGSEVEIVGLRTQSAGPTFIILKRIAAP